MKREYEDDWDFDLGEYYEELEALIDQSKDQGIVSTGEMLGQMDFLREATHRNTKKALNYARKHKHQKKLQKLAAIYRAKEVIYISDAPIKLVGHRKYVKTSAGRKNKLYTYNKRALRRELKNIDIDVSSGNAYKNIRGRIRSKSTKSVFYDYYYSHHRNIRNKYASNDDIAFLSVSQVSCAIDCFPDYLFCKDLAQVS